MIPGRGGDAVLVLHRQRGDQRAGHQRRRRSGPVMTFERINPPELAAPRGFSHAVGTDRPRTVYLAGQTALDASGPIVGDDVVEPVRAGADQPACCAAQPPADRHGPGDRDDLHRRHGRLPSPRARDRRGLARLAGTDYPAMAGIGVSPAVGRRGTRRGTGHRGAGLSQTLDVDRGQNGSRAGLRNTASRSANRSAALPPLQRIREQLDRQARVEVGQSAPLGQHRYVDLECSASRIGR